MQATKVRKPRQRRQHERTVKVLVRPSAGQPETLLEIIQDGKEAHYWLKPLPADFGRAFRLEKPGTEGDEVYDMLLDDQTGDSCTCKGHTYGGFCKHLDAVRAFLACRQGARRSEVDRLQTRRSRQQHPVLTPHHHRGGPRPPAACGGSNP